MVKNGSEWFEWLRTTPTQSQQLQPNPNNSNPIPTTPTQSQQLQPNPNYSNPSLIMVTDFEELAIYQKSRALAKQVYEITRQGEFKFDSRFVQQIRAAAGSVSDNIAEGFERQGNKEFKNFLYIAKGSCGEVRSQINRAHDVGFISDETYKQMYDDCKKLAISINHFIQSLKESTYKGSRYNDPTQS